jgi:hypothetical protein
LAENHGKSRSAIRISAAAPALPSFPEFMMPTTPKDAVIAVRSEHRNEFYLSVLLFSLRGSGGFFLTD